MSRARRTRRSGAVFAGAAAALLLTACTVSGPAPTPTPTPAETVAPSGDGVLRIGAVLSLTGAEAAQGAAQLAGVNAAVRAINLAGGVNGVPVEVVSRDAGEVSGDMLDTSFATLIDRGVDVVIGPSSTALVERLVPLAVAAKIPLFAPSSRAERAADASDEGWFFRSVPSYAHQGAALGAALPDTKAAEVALVSADDELSLALAQQLESSLSEHDGELVASAQLGSATGAARAVATVAAAKPDAVILATPDSGELTHAALVALVDAGFGGAKLWLTTHNLADYSAVLAEGTLDGAQGVLDGADPDDAFRALLRLEDPAITDVRFAAEAYDSTITAALAAILAGDDGGPSIASRIADATRGGVVCTSFGACIDVLSTEPSVAFEGVSGALRFDSTGEPSTGTYGLYRADSSNRFARVGPFAG